MTIPALISDLAIILLTAGVIAIIFKRIRQPLVLGYILAGFLVSTYFPWFSTIKDEGSIETWSEIGIIFLMFHLGLEFNLHKLAEVGSTAIITCIVDVIGMLAAGYLAGSALGFSEMDSIVLGGMLAMSSTMVILKVFDEMGTKEKYTEGVLGTLVMQDIVGIFMMVILSTVAVSRNVSGMEVMGKLFIMLLYLVLWLVLGILVVPTFLDKTVKYMNDEMLMILSLGICFGMVLLSNRMGFSSALGAFLSGSLLAGTIHVERIEEITKNIKDLFGAIFFVSVGMMVDPAMLVKYAVPILVIFAVTITGKIFFNALGMIISGQSLTNSVKSGFALAQIGEFAFIIASLGNSLGVLDDFMYPIAVAVSVVTIFTTPILIRLAEPAAGYINRKLPAKLKDKLERFTSDEQDEKEHDSDWYLYIRKYFVRLFVYGGIMLVVAVLGMKFLYPALSSGIGETMSGIVTILIIYAIDAAFVRPLMNPHDNLFTAIRLKHASFKMPLLALNVIKLAIVVIIAMVPVRAIFGVNPLWLVILLTLVVIIAARSGYLATWYLQLETRFLKNFNERLIAHEESAGRRQEWLDTKLKIMSFFAPENATYLDKPLSSLDWGRLYNVYIVKIKKGDNLEKQYLLPGPDLTIETGNKVFVVGEEKALNNFYAMTGLQKTKPLRTLKKFMDTGYADIDNALAICPIKIRGDESFANKPIRQGQVRKHYNVAILGLQREGLPIIMPDPNFLLVKDDILWVIGSNKNVGRLITEYVDETE